MVIERSNAHSIDPEETELFRRYLQNADMRARDELFQRFVHIAEIVARKFSGRGVEYADLFQVASLAMLKAFDRFDVSRGVKFPVFGMPAIVGEVKNYFRDRTRLIRVSRRDVELIKSMEDAKQELTQTLGTIPRPKDIAVFLGIPVETVLELMETQRAYSVSSLDSKTGVDESADLLEILGGEERGFERVEMRLLLKKMMRSLSETERFIINERYFREKSQRQVAKELGVSQMFISRTERKILIRFKNAFSSVENAKGTG
ncbi:MAG: sigma-70 family RNA polymerase sigma factor [Bacillota bacterium]